MRISDGKNHSSHRVVVLVTLDFHNVRQVDRYNVGDKNSFYIKSYFIRMVDSYHAYLFNTLEGQQQISDFVNVRSCSGRS